MSAHRAHLVTALPRGEAIRNFVYSGVLDRVRAQMRVTVATVIPNQELRTLLEQRYGDLVELSEGSEHWAVGAVRELLDSAHGRWLWSEAAQERWRLRDAEAHGPVARSKRLAKKSLATLLARPSALDRMQGLYESAAARWPTTSYRALLESLAPSLVFNGSHVHSGPALGLLIAARSQRVPSAAFLFSWDNLTSQGRIIPGYDFYLVWSERIRDDLLQTYPRIDPSSVLVTGTPQFDAHFREDLRWTRDEYCGRIGADSQRPIVLYTTGMANHMPGEPAIVELLADQLAELPSHPQLVVRIYAKDRTGRFDSLRSRRPDILFPAVPWEPNWLTPLPADTELWTNMLLHADLGVNVASTVSLELCMFDKPVVNIGFNPPGVPLRDVSYARYYRFDHYAPLVASGAIDVAWSPDQLQECVRDAFERPGRLSVARRSLMGQLFGPYLDGNAGARVAERLIDWCSVDVSTD